MLSQPLSARSWAPGSPATPSTEAATTRDLRNRCGKADRSAVSPTTHTAARQLGLHAKPVALVDLGTFWDPVTRMLTELTAAGFVPAATARSLIRVSGAAEFLGLLR